MYLNMKIKSVLCAFMGLTLTLDVFKWSPSKVFLSIPRWLTLTLDVFKCFITSTPYPTINRLTLTLDVFKCFPELFP